MKTSHFFEQKLGVKLKNVQWSWGAVNHNSKQVFLRFWKDQIRSEGNVEKVDLLWNRGKEKSPGAKERRKHIDYAKNGYSCFGVRCEAADVNARPRKISKYEESYLYPLDQFEESEGNIHARVGKPIHIDLLSMVPQGEENDIKAIVENPSIDSTAKAALIMARVGQGKFRANVLAVWGSACCVTGSKVLEVINASHIKPWRDSTNEERLDSNNGLPLVANLDSLFDVGLISFDQNGEILISRHLPKTEVPLLVGGSKLIAPLSEKTKKYLAYHLEKIFRK